jgi:hypothetical protein
MLTKIDNTIKKAIMFFGTGAVARTVYDVTTFLYRVILTSALVLGYIIISLGACMYLIESDQNLFAIVWFGFSVIGFIFWLQYRSNRQTGKTLNDPDC